MKSSIKRNWKFYTCLLIAIIVIICIAFYRIKLLNLDYIASYSPTVNSEKYDKSYESKTEGDEVGQTFEAKYNNLEKIYLKFDNLKVENSYILSGGTATIGIKNIDGSSIYEKEINLRDLHSNSDYIFEFPKISDSQGKMYYLYVRCDNLEEGKEFYKICYSEENLCENGDMYINGEKQSGDLFFQEMYHETTKITILAIFMVLIVAIISLIAITIYTQKDIKVEKLFWMIIPCMFIMFLLVMPAFKSHDEAFHWFRIYDIAQGHYLSEIIDNKPQAVADEEIINITNLQPENITYKYIKEKLQNRTESSNNQTLLDLSTTAIYNPLQYMPQTMRSIIS